MKLTGKDRKKMNDTGVSELIKKLDDEKMKGLTDFEYVQFFDALKDLEMYQKTGTIAEFMELKEASRRNRHEVPTKDRTAPHIVQKARILQDKNRWCCVLGDVLTGIAGYGNTPEQACAEFDRIWRKNEVLSQSESYEDKYTIEQIVDAVTQADAEIAAAIEQKNRELLEDVLKDSLDTKRQLQRFR